MLHMDSNLIVFKVKSINVDVLEVLFFVVEVLFVEGYFRDFRF